MHQQTLELTEQAKIYDDLAEELRKFDSYGTRTQCESVEGVPYFINEFWTSRQRQAHRLHEVSYRACFKAQLPRFFIDRLTSEGDVVYDPFMGRGTTLLEAALLDRIPYGNDINPLSRALVEPRLKPATLEEIEQRLQTIPWDAFTQHTREDLLVFYHPKTLAQLEGLRNWLIEKENSENWDYIDAWIRMVAINRLTGHSSGFFSVYTLPPNQAVTVERQRRINEKRSQKPDFRDIAQIILRKSKSLLSQGGPDCKSFATFTSQSWSTPAIESDTVALTVTSPPFLDIVNYESDNWLRCWFLGTDPNSVAVTRHKNVSDWQLFIRNTLTELARISKPGGFIAFEVGEVRKGSIQLEQNVIAAAEGLPLKTIGVMINQQEFTKTANCWGISNNKSGTNSNRIIILQKEK